MDNLKSGDKVVYKGIRDSNWLTPGREYEVFRVWPSGNLVIDDDRGLRITVEPKNFGKVEPRPDALAWAKERFASDPEARAVLGDLLHSVYGIVATPKTTFEFGPAPF